MPDKFVYGKQKFNKNKRGQLRANVEFLELYVDYLYDNTQNQPLTKKKQSHNLNNYLN